MKPAAHTAECVKIFQRCATLKGAVAECGVAEGLTTFALDKETLRVGKKLYAFDTFEGFPYDDAIESQYQLKKGDFNFGEKFFATFNSKLATSVIPVRGQVEKTLLRYRDERFCFVWLDMDLYQPTAFAYKFFEGRMVAGGVIGFHDYKFVKCPGIAQVVDEELDVTKFDLLLVRDYCVFFQRRGP